MLNHTTVQVGDGSTNSTDTNSVPDAFGRVQVDT